MGTPREALFGCSVGSRGSTRHEGRRAGRRTLKEAESSREDETSSEDGADGGRRETAWARVKIRGRGGSGEPNDPAIRPHTRLRGATNFTRGGAVWGQPELSGGRRGWNLRRGPSFRSASGSLGTLKGREHLSGFAPFEFLVNMQLGRRKAASTLSVLVGFGAWGSRRKVPGRVHPPRIRFGTRQPKLQSISLPHAGLPVPLALIESMDASRCHPRNR
jgi:hypothetical protein